MAQEDPRMSARNHVLAGYYQRRINYGREVHLGRVGRSADETAKAGKIKQRFDIIKKMGIESGKEASLPNGVSGVVRLIKSDGVIMFEDLNIIDPLNL